MIVITAPSIHADAVQALADYRLVFCAANSSEEELARICEQNRPLAIMVRYGNISSAVIAAAGPQLQVIAKHGVGIDNIDAAYAAACRIPVLAAPGSNSQAVAELAIGLLMACARRLVWLDGRMRQGHWDKDSYDGIELAGRTLGLIGYGAIGQRVGAIAIALGMRVQVFDPHAIKAALPASITSAGLDELLRTSDAISLHCPLNPDTRHLINAERLAVMKAGAILINTARAGLIHEPALLVALHARHLWAGLDCFAQEPVAPDHPLALAPQTVLTPHIGGSSDAAYRQMGVSAATNILKVLQVGP